MQDATIILMGVIQMGTVLLILYTDSKVIKLAKGLLQYIKENERQMAILTKKLYPEINAINEEV